MISLYLTSPNSFLVICVVGGLFLCIIGLGWDHMLVPLGPTVTAIAFVTRPAVGRGWSLSQTGSALGAIAIDLVVPLMAIRAFQPFERHSVGHVALKRLTPP